MLSCDSLLNILFKSNLARLNLPHPEAVFEINFFRRNPVPCASHILSDELKLTTFSLQKFTLLHMNSTQENSVRQLHTPSFVSLRNTPFYSSVLPRILIPLNEGLASPTGRSLKRMAVSRPRDVLIAGSHSMTR